MHKQPKHPTEPIDSDGNTIIISSFWAPSSRTYGVITREMSDNMCKFIAQETYAHVQKSLQLITNMDSSEETIKAKFDMADRYRYGWGVVPNYEKYLDLYKTCADAGYVLAGYELARLYFNGDKDIGVVRNLRLAKNVVQTTLLAAPNLSFNTQFDIKRLTAYGKVIDAHLKKDRLQSAQPKSTMTRNPTINPNASAHPVSENLGQVTAENTNSSHSVKLFAPRKLKKQTSLPTMPTDYRTKSPTPRSSSGDSND